jgi:hypothetical protein
MTEGKMRLIMGLAACAAGVATGTETPGAAGPYDGTYEGKLLVLKGGPNHPCATTVTKPAVLTIVDGHAQARWGAGLIQGDVGSDGTLIMHTDAPGRFEGHIEASGALVGHYQSYCIFDLAWQRRKA